MRSLVLLAATAALVYGQAALPARQPSDTPPLDYRTLKFPPLPEVKLPDVPVTTLPNGIKLYLLENHELPLISGFALVRTGNLFDPKDKIGLATITGMVIRTGGTAAKTGDELDVQLENIAASVEAGIGESSGRVGFSCLKENVDEVLGIFKDVLTGPEFRQDKIELAKNQLRAGIARRNDDASDIASREFASIVYGRDNPYGWDMEYATVDAIKREDMVGFYRRYFFPSNIMMAISGDFSAPEMRAKIEKLFATWTVQQPKVPEFPPVPGKTAPGVYLAVKNDVTQTFFRMGHLGGELKDPDFPALSVMSDILGGSFSSRLFTNVRTKLGYVYSIGGGWGADYDHPGLFTIAGSTQSAKTVDAIKAAQAEIERMRTTEVTEDELESARQTVLNGFVFNFDSPTKTLSRTVTYDYYGYPHDFIFRYQKAVASTTKADILRVAKKHINPSIMTTVAVGKPAEFGTPLTALTADVKNIDLTIPEPGQPADADSKPAASAETTAKGKQLLARAQQAMGGADKLAAVQDLSIESNASVSTPQGDLTIKQTAQWLRSGILRSTQELPFGKIVIYFDGKGGGWMVAPQGETPLPPQASAQIQDQLFKMLPTLLLSDRDPNRTVNAVGDNKVEISDKEGHSITLELDANGLPLHETYRRGPNLVTETLSDWKDAGGLKYAGHSVVEQGGNKMAESTVTSFKVNSGLTAEDLSKKP